MTLSTSDNAIYLRIARNYVIAAIGCAAFALIYAQFSHGVHSVFMTYMFAIPLLCGALPAVALHVTKFKRRSRTARQAWAFGVASLTIGSCLKGIFDIAGTASHLVVVYAFIAGLCAILALGSFIKSAKTAV